MARPAEHVVTFSPKPSPAATALLVMMVSASVVLWLLGPEDRAWMLAHFGLVPREALGRRPWQLVTSAFLYMDVLSLLLASAGVLLIAAPLEHRLGRRWLVAMLAAGQLTGMAAVATTARLVGGTAAAGARTGCGPGLIALVLAFGALHASTPVRVWAAQLSGRTLAALLVGLAAAVAVLRHDWPALVGDLVGVAAGTVGTVLVVGRISAEWRAWRVRRMRRRYRVIQGGLSLQRRA